MNLIDYNKAMEALDKERQLLLNREQYGAENVLVHHAISIIAELPIIRQPRIVCCKDCPNQECEDRNGRIVCDITGESHDPDWFCADGKQEEGR